MNVAIVVALVVILAVAGLWARARAQSRQEPAAPPPLADPGATSHTVALDVAQPPDDDRDRAAARRLADETIAAVLSANPQVSEVRVLSREGTVLAHYQTATGEAAPIDAPTPGPEGLGGDPAPERSLADRLDLAEGIRSQLKDPDDPVGLVQAILEAGGYRTRREDNVIRAGDQTVIVIAAAPEVPVTRRDLNEAWFAFKASGAREGLVLTTGVLNPQEARRRELMAPTLHHVGPEGIQRMADAASLGGDPLHFAAGAGSGAGFVSPATAGEPGQGVPPAGGDRTPGRAA